jgi:Siphovirus-type tail component, C-terminal domain
VQAELSDVGLGVLELGCDPYVVTSLQVGSPEVREVVRYRALADGTLDDTRYLGARAITMSIRFKDKLLRPCGPNGENPSMQSLIDQLSPYMSVRRRPTLTWQLPGSTELRAAVVRGVNWGWAVEGPKAQTIVPQWIVPSGEITAGGPDALHCENIKPTVDVEAGRTYDLAFDRVYPPSEPIGGRTIINPGTAPTNWVLTIYGPVVNPSFTVHGIRIKTDRQGGVNLPVGQSLVIDTRNRTVLLNGSVATSRYQCVNYDEWSWDDLMLEPGSNIVRFDGTGITAQTSADLCFTPVFVG